MNTLLVLAAAVIASVASPEQRAEIRYRHTGGKILERGTYKGKVAIFNAAGERNQADAIAAAETLRTALGINVEAMAGAETDPSVALGASSAKAVILLLSDAKAPMLLLAPEERWAVVNVGRIVDDLPAEKAKEQFRSPRLRKQIVKAFCALLGGSASQYPGNLMNTTKTRELDLCQEQIPFDVVDKVQKYASAIGITQAAYTTYKKACQEGWAPQPTNDVQRAIWDKVHAPPEKPMKITYDKAAKKPVVK